MIIKLRITHTWHLQSFKKTKGRALTGEIEELDNFGKQ
jgi:hypothetical protein